MCGEGMSVLVVEQNVRAAVDIADTACVLDDGRVVFMGSARKNVFVPVPQAQTYTYANNPWRGDSVSPMAANMQWDVYSNGSRLLVKMLYNERETDFQAECDGAKVAPNSHFYDYTQLKRCYSYG
jgi:hypothetical protein